MFVLELEEDGRAELPEDLCAFALLLTDDSAWERARDKGRMPKPVAGEAALGVLHAAHSTGKHIPHDLSVVGVDGIAEGSSFWPSLTTVRQPLAQAGALAVEAIVRTIRSTRGRTRGEEAQGGQPSLLQPELVLRESSRPVA